MNAVTVEAIYRYPVKGLSPQRLDGVMLEPGRTLPGDRLYAIENGPSGFDAAAPAHLPKRHFLMLMFHERLARLVTRYDETSQEIAISAGGAETLRADLSTATGREAVERFFADFCAEDLRGAPKLLRGPDGHSFSNVARRVVSIINLSSVAAIAAAIGKPVNPLRFRGNVYVRGWQPWEEFELVGRTLKIGPAARLSVVKRIVRCAATDVDPETGARDLDIPGTLRATQGHVDCGVYAEVTEAGAIAVGSALRAD